MSSCIFCDIVEGTAEASMIYRDDRCCAFLDIFHASQGHVLVIPLAHAASMGELDGKTGGHLLEVGMDIAAAIRRSDIRCEGINFHLADGRAAGQEIFHVHLHIIPRVAGDGFGFKFARGRAARQAKAELDRTAEAIRSALQQA